MYHITVDIVICICICIVVCSFLLIPKYVGEGYWLRRRAGRLDDGSAGTIGPINLLLRA